MSIQREFAARAGTVAEYAAVAVLSATAAALAYAWVSRMGLTRRATSVGIDIVDLQSRILNVSGRAGVDVNDLGGGIIELVGESRDGDEARALIDSVTGAPGVEVVLDRLWVRTPRLVS